MAALRKAGPTRPIGRPRKYKTNTDRQRAYRQRLKRSVYFRSTTGLWSTPQAFFDVLDAEFHFTTDVCALPENAKCTHYYTPEQDGLRQEWAGVCFMNAPYGLPLRQWVAKAYASAQAGVLVVCLLPVRTDTQWWHAYVLPYATEVRYLKGRLTFGGACHTAPFPLAVVIFRPPINGSSGEVDALGDICACADMTRDATITAITQSTSQFPGSSALLILLAKSEIDAIHVW